MNELLRHLNDPVPKTIIYTRSRRNVEMISTFLKSHSIRAEYYHAGLSFSDKKKIQDRFLKSDIEVIASTNAFGMGIDIPDVTQILHYDIPPSLEEYYQEIGRAGRDGTMSKAVLIYDEADVKYHDSRLLSEFPPFDKLYSCYSKVHRFYNNLINEGEGRKQALDILSLSKYVGKGSRDVHKQLEALSKLNCISLEDNPRDVHCIKYAVSPRNLREIYLTGELAQLRDYLMRQYVDSPDEWIKIQIENIAKRIKLSPDKVIELIKQLKQKRLINHHLLPQGPLIIFNEGRLNQKDFNYKSKRYTKLKELKEERMSSMAAYIKCERCLNEYLLGYFNEDHPDNCDLCHNCLNRDSQEMSRKDIEDMDNHQLTQTLNTAMKEKDQRLLNILQSMAGEGIISLDIASTLEDEGL